MFPAIKRFTIRGLFEDRTVNLDFGTNSTILVDPNGSGKTTFMRALVLILKRQWHQLAEISFSDATVLFHDNETVTIERDRCVNWVETMPVYKRLTSAFTEKELSLLRQMVFLDDETALTRKAQRILEMPRSQLRRFLHSHFQGQASLFDEANPDPLGELDSRIRKSFPFELVYFPTYRRVEAALLAEEEDLIWDDMSIHYGMHDVKRRIDLITSEIKTSFVESYSKISAQMLTQLIEGIHVETKEINDLSESKYIEIVLERLGDNISKADKAKLLELVRSDAIKQSNFTPLVYFVNNLMSVYKEQREKDDAIKRFAKIVNEYFDDKIVIYNESRVSLEIINKRTGRPVTLQHLSSGEKQVVSIFSRLHLSEGQAYAIFFDEPELSLSIEWQRKLLSDISRSESCKFLFAATHSPFIYENELDESATTLTTSFNEDAV